MNTNKFLMMSAIFALMACTGEDMKPESQGNVVQNELEPITITFNLTASHPNDATTRSGEGGAWHWQAWDVEDDDTYDILAETRAVKQTWEAGDAIFVFFSGAAAPRHLKMTFDGTEWTSTEYDGDTASPGALCLKNGDTGTMRAIFLPFGSGATVSASCTSFTFNKTYYTYYLTATLPYEVTDHEVSGAFDMQIPEGYVQFFVADRAATDEGYMLGTCAVIPTGVASIADNGDITETSDKTSAYDMAGYAYQGGYLFSGKLANTNSGTNFYIAKTNSSNSNRADYLVTGKTIASHSAIKLPANGDSKWMAVGKDITVQLGGTYRNKYCDLGTWYTCNLNQSVPEASGDLLDLDNVNDNALPTEDDINLLIGDRRSYQPTWIGMTVHGQSGTVCKTDAGYMFLPHAGAGYWVKGRGLIDFTASTKRIIDGRGRGVRAMVRIKKN